MLLSPARPLLVPVEGWRDGRMRSGGVEGWRGIYIPLLPNGILKGHPHPTVPCPAALPSHSKIHISQPSCPKPFPVPYLPRSGSLALFRPRSPTSVAVAPFLCSLPAHFPFPPQPEQTNNVLGQGRRQKPWKGEKNQGTWQPPSCTLKNTKFPYPKRQWT